MWWFTSLSQAEAETPVPELLGQHSKTLWQKIKTSIQANRVDVSLQQVGFLLVFVYLF